MRYQHSRRHRLAGLLLRSSVTPLLTAAWLAGGAGYAASAADWSTQIQASRDAFTPISDEHLAAARSEMIQRAEGLERYVQPNTANGRRWLEYLRWDAFREELAGDEPRFEPLVTTYEQLNRDEAGLERAPFRRLSDALRRYIDLSAIYRQQDQADAYARQLDALAGELERYDQRPSAELRAAIGRRIDFLAGLGQARDLVVAVRRSFSQPNAYVTVSARYLTDALGDPIDRREPVTDCILGTTIYSKTHTTGGVRMRTIRADDRAVVEISSAGDVRSRNVGYNGPAVIHSSALTGFTASTRVELSDESFRSYPTHVHATTNSNIHSIGKKGGGFGDKLVSKIGWKKAREKKGQADRIAARHAERRIARRVEDETSDALRDAWERYQDEYRHPLERRGELPEFSRFRSTDDALTYELTQANRSQLAAPSAPPAASAAADLVVRLHETAINNYTASMLGGATIRETEPGAGTKADVPLPKWIKDAWEKRMDEKADDAGDDAFEPWSLTFRRDRPITVAFVDGNVELTIHLAHLKSGDDEFERWDVTGSFVPELTDGGVTLRREGELVVLPTDFDRERGQLSSRQAALRRNLTRVLTERSDEGRGFPLSIDVDPLEPTGEFADAGPLPVEEFTTGNGWLTVAWNRN